MKPRYLALAILAWLAVPLISHAQVIFPANLWKDNSGILQPVTNSYWTSSTKYCLGGSCIATWPSGGGGSSTTVFGVSPIVVSALVNGNQTTTCPTCLTTSTGLTTANFSSPNISQWTNNSGYITTSTNNFGGLTNASITALAPILWSSTSTIYCPTCLTVTTGNWAGTWQGVNSSTFYLASNPSAFISAAITSINGDTTPAQVVTSTAPLTVATSAGKTTLACASCLTTSTAASTYYPLTNPSAYTQATYDIAWTIANDTPGNVDVIHIFNTSSTIKSIYAVQTATGTEQFMLGLATSTANATSTLRYLFTGSSSTVAQQTSTQITVNGSSSANTNDILEIYTLGNTSSTEFHLDVYYTSP